MKHSLVSDKLSVTINYAGAEISSVKNKEELEFIWQADKAIWPRHAPVLFPIVGKLKENSFVFNNGNYQLGQHGFARDKAFELLEGDARSCVFQLRSDEESKKIFPFEFVFQIKYELDGSQLITHYSILNPSSETLYFSVGAHPGFNCPLQKNETFEDYYLEFEHDDLFITKLNTGLRKETADAKQKLSLKGKRLNLSKEIFENDALVFENSQIHKVSLCSHKSEHKITLECANWPYFGIWSKKGCTDFVCLEPWYGIADHESASGQLTQKDGIIRLPAKKDFHCSFSLNFG